MTPALVAVFPSALERDRFIAVVAKAIIGSPKLMECTRASLAAAIHEAAQLGLEPTGLLGSAYLVPYRRNVAPKGQRAQWISEAKLIPGYRGLIDLARRSGEIEAVEAKLVHRRDTFRLLEGTEPSLVHERFIPDPTDAPEERDPGPVVGAYMVATLRGGHRQVEWMTADEIDVVRRSSKAADDGPWVNHYGEMARKTVVRRGSKYLPMTTEFRRALELDEEAERGAEAPPPVAVTRATQMLLDRAARGGSEGSPDTTREENESPSRSGEGSAEREGAETAETDAREVCGADNPDLGVCTKEPDHDGAHGNLSGVWPR
jgi:recombination protein RecT